MQSQLNLPTARINDSDEERAQSKQRTKTSKNEAGIRDIKSLFAQLQQDEDAREEMMKIEEEELGFAPDNDEVFNEFEPAFDNSDDNATDSDADYGELGGSAKLDLFNDIMGAIKAFSVQYSGQTCYNLQDQK